MYIDQAYIGAFYHSYYGILEIVRKEYVIIYLKCVNQKQVCFRDFLF